MLNPADAEEFITPFEPSDEGEAVCDKCGDLYFTEDDCPCESYDDDDYDGQPDEYTEWQDYMGGDDWDHGQYDDCGW